MKKNDFYTQNFYTYLIFTRSSSLFRKSRRKDEERMKKNQGRVEERKRKSRGRVEEKKCTIKFLEKLEKREIHGKKFTRKIKNQ
ncbi:hypothetical protein BpHYR1_005603 [Brachionus plicatilis]|uniref:Uncharacterized protein n=1 Tax=Brachionus plicatilis TaxID=10195 RepID=A0A3M7PWZ0_BRAPC|nr:hypothetical protein BpHYR1_005603 [Brachionus plicatilis]